MNNENNYTKWITRQIIEITIIFRNNQIRMIDDAFKFYDLNPQNPVYNLQGTTLSH